ncbi:hypothetical protein DVH24_005337, partial [Malus domestica]
PNRALIRYSGEHRYPNKVRIRCGTNTHTLAEAVILCDVVYKRDNKSPEGLNWFSGWVIIKAQRVGDVDQGDRHKQAQQKGVVRDEPKESEGRHASAAGCRDPSKMVNNPALGRVPWSVQDVVHWRTKI